MKEKWLQAQGKSINLNTIHSEKYGPSEKTMINLYSSLIRPVMDYGHIALITTNLPLLKPLEIIQTKFIRRTLNMPKVSKEITLKMANLPSMRDRMLDLAHRWLEKAKVENVDIKSFINTRVYKTSQLKTPYSILTGKYISN